MRGIRSQSVGNSLPLVLCLTIQALDLSGARPALAAEATTAPGAAVQMSVVATRPTGGAMLATLNVPAPPSAPCHQVDEVNAALFAGRQPVGYDVAGADAGRLSSALNADAAAAFADVSVIRVVLLFSTREAIAFQFGSNGCHVITRDMRIDEMGDAFDRAGVYAPFGPTYYQGIGRAI